MNGWEYLQQLEAQRKQNPQAALLLIQEYENILAQWPPDQYSDEYASIQANLGRSYFELSVGDPNVALARAIICSQEASRVWKAETASDKYARTQYNRGLAYLHIKSCYVVHHECLCKPAEYLITKEVTFPSSK